MSEKVPVGWTRTTLREIGRLSKGKGISKNEVKSDGLPCIRYAEIYTDHDYVIREFKSFVDRNAANDSVKLSKGDLIFAGSGETVDEIGKSVAFIDDFDAYVGGDAIVLTPAHSANSVFLAYQLNHDSSREYLRKVAQGSSIIHIYATSLASLPINIPPLFEQRKIAAVLTSVDDVIEKTEAQIRKLEDLKKATMNELLTKGIGHTEFKDSPVGRIPKSWGLKTLIELSTDGIKNGVFRDPKKVGTGYRLINVFDMYSDLGINTTDLERVNIGQAEFERNQVFYGDVFFTRSSLKLEGIAYCNINTSTQDDVTYDGHLMRVRPNSSFITPVFLAYYCRSDNARSFLMKRAKHSTMTTIGQNDIRELPIPLPAMPEQQKIVDAVGSITAQEKSLKRYADSLSNLKIGLMNQLLSGKVRVNWDGD